MCSQTNGIDDSGLRAEIIANVTDGADAWPQGSYSCSVKAEQWR